MKFAAQDWTTFQDREREIIFGLLNRRRANLEIVVGTENVMQSSQIHRLCPSEKISYSSPNFIRYKPNAFRYDRVNVSICKYAVKRHLDCAHLALVWGTVAVNNGWNDMLGRAGK